MSSKSIRECESADCVKSIQQDAECETFDAIQDRGFFTNIFAKKCLT